MTTFIITLFLLYLFLTNRKRVKQAIYINNLTSVYEKMEIYVVNNNINLNINPEIVQFLRSHKTIVVNPEFADIDIFLGAIRKQRGLSNKTKLAQKTKNEIPEGLEELSHEFHKSFIKMLRLSMLKWSFIKKCILCAILAMSEQFFQKGRAIDKAFTYIFGERNQQRQDIRNIILNRQDTQGVLMLS